MDKTILHRAALEGNQMLVDWILMFIAPYDIDMINQYLSGYLLSNSNNPNSSPASPKKAVSTKGLSIAIKGYVH
jgi:hypothetical protein